MGEFISMGTSIQTDPERVAVILEVVMDFFDGAPSDALSKRVSAQLGKISAGEFAYTAQILANKDDGSEPFEAKVQRELLMHEVFQNALEDAIDPDLAEGHPVTTMRRENAALGELAAKIRLQMTAAVDTKFDATTWQPLIGDLGQVDIHYTRKENQLFPFLERKGFDRPSTVMWALHDEIRASVKSASEALVDPDPTEFHRKVTEAIDGVEDMIQKEDQVLIPTSLELLDDDDWTAIRSGDGLLPDLDPRRMECPRRDRDSGRGRRDSTVGSTVNGAVRGIDSGTD